MGRRARCFFSGAGEGGARGGGRGEGSGEERAAECAGPFSPQPPPPRPLTNPRGLPDKHPRILARARGGKKEENGRIVGLKKSSRATETGAWRSFWRKDGAPKKQKKRGRARAAPRFSSFFLLLSSPPLVFLFGRFEFRTRCFVFWNGEEGSGGTEKKIEGKKGGGRRRRFSGSRAGLVAGV